MHLGIPPLDIENLPGSSPLRSRFLVRGTGRIPGGRNTHLRGGGRYHCLRYCCLELLDRELFVEFRKEDELDELELRNSSSIRVSNRIIPPSEHPGWQRLQSRRGHKSALTDALLNAHECKVKPLRASQSLSETFHLHWS